MTTSNPIYRFLYIICSFFLLAGVAYIAPAAFCTVICWDFSVYGSIVTSPAYAGLYGVFSFIATAVYIAQQVDDGKM